jgi:hypothetical protein
MPGLGGPGPSAGADSDIEMDMDMDDGSDMDDDAQDEPISTLPPASALPPAPTYNASRGRRVRFGGGGLVLVAQSQLDFPRSGEDEEDEEEF